MRERQRNIAHSSANSSSTTTAVTTTVAAAAEERKAATPVPETADLLQLHTPSEPPSPSPLTPQNSLPFKHRNSPSRNSGSSTGSKRATAVAGSGSASPIPGTSYTK
jgi:hypothetical protein